MGLENRDILGPEMATHLHKITNIPAFYRALGLNDFDGGKSITWAIERGLPL
jgi:hypothetical protein